ncbi:MAG TPA: tRNA (adenosine(37)-N6)-threonylcarbamoyltransferase complex ATPase subunit type 1 TsaE [Parafilimonas sp.]|nr:tRNA (adenosine(37)-N6)-threonylcarbamoyltransferase complex ATPase subunit type 1 TsaE [Parafilimonas sp.]
MKINFHLSQIKDVAVQLWQQYHQYKIWAFNAPMGAGKTTLIHSLCNVLNVTSTVTSPTFAIINEYESSLAGIIYHMDWYRLKDSAEIIQTGCEDCLESGNLCFIEWAEKADELLPLNSLHINLEIIDTQERRLIVK